MSSVSTSSDPAVEPIVEAAEVQTLPKRPFPDIDAGYFLHGHEPANGEVIVLMRQSALEQVRIHSISNLRTELGGVLLGKAFRADGHLCVEIEAAIPAVSNNHGPAHFTFEADTWPQIHQDREMHYPNLDIVGWFHTHPALSVFYSSDDVVVHSAAFTLPWHVGLVVDPIRNEACFFGWQQNELTPFTGYYEALDSQPTPIVPWRVVRTEVWQAQPENLAHVYNNQMPENNSFAHQQSAISPVEQLPLSRSFLGLVAGVAGAILTFFLLVGWVAVLNQQVEQLENVVLMMADEVLVQSNAALCPNPNMRILSPLTAQTAVSGSEIEILGTAVYPEARKYRVEGRILGSGSEWLTIGIRRRDTDLGKLATWKTVNAPLGNYEVRLVALDNNNIRLANAPTCTIEINIK